MLFFGINLFRDHFVIHIKRPLDFRNRDMWVFEEQEAAVAEERVILTRN